ncbi:hypothetical protein [Pedobacter sp. BS3]|nr:hypothetical protein [Pedobacter sp. BS3]
MNDEDWDFYPQGKRPGEERNGAILSAMIIIAFVLLIATILLNNFFTK